LPAPALRFKKNPEQRDRGFSKILNCEIEVFQKSSLTQSRFKKNRRRSRKDHSGPAPE
jgi:hypothetical protein